MACDARVESYFFAGLPGTRELTVTDVDNSTTLAFTIPFSMTVTEALVYWQFRANTQMPTSGYEFFFDSATNRIIMRNTTLTEIQLFFHDSLYKALGFNLIATSGSNTYTSDKQPPAIADIIGVSHDAYRNVVDLQAEEARWGRHDVYQFHAARGSTFMCVGTTQQIDELLKGPLFSARMRLWTDLTALQQYSQGTRDGFHDVYPHKIDSVERMGITENHTKVTFQATEAEVES